MRLTDLYEDDFETDMGGDSQSSLNMDVWQKVEKHPFVTEFEHDSASPYYPQTLASTGRGELAKIKGLANREKSERDTSQPYGKYANQDFGYYRQLINFIDTVMMMQKDYGDDEAEENEFSPNNIRKKRNQQKSTRSEA